MFDFLLTCITACDCSMIGTVTNSSCDKDSGMCLCKRYVTGERCDTCYVSGSSKKLIEKIRITSLTPNLKYVHTFCFYVNLFNLWYANDATVLEEQKTTRQEILTHYLCTYILGRLNVVQSSFQSLPESCINVTVVWNSKYIDAQLKIWNTSS